MVEMGVLAVTFNFAFFFAVGLVNSLSLEVIVCVAIVWLFFRPTPVGFNRAVNILAFIVATTAALVSFTYFAEFYLAWYHGNPYELWALLRSSVAGPITDLAHWVHPASPKLPWAPYWWIYYATISADLCLQLLWIPAVRRRPVLILCVTLPALLAARLGQLVAACALLSH